MTDTSPSLWDSWCLTSTSDKAKDTRLRYMPFINNLPQQNSSVIPSTHFCHWFSNSIAVVISRNIATWFRSLFSSLEVAKASLPSCYTSLSEKIMFYPSYFDISPSSFAVDYYLMLYGKYTASQHSLYDSHNTSSLFRKQNCRWAICFSSCTKMLLLFPQSHSFFWEMCRSFLITNSELSVLADVYSCLAISNTGSFEYFLSLKPLVFLWFFWCLTWLILSLPIWKVLSPG